MGRFFHLFLTKEPPIFWSWVPMLPSVSASSNPAVDPAGSCCGQTPSCARPRSERRFSNGEQNCVGPYPAC